MKAGSDYTYRPEWIENALTVRCAFCHDQPGARYPDGSGKCEACNGAAWITLATREPASHPEQPPIPRASIGTFVGCRCEFECRTCFDHGWVPRQLGGGPDPEPMPCPDCGFLEPAPEGEGGEAS